MAKALFLIMSGADSPMKMELGITAAVRSLQANRYEDLKVIFFGPSEEYLTKIEGQVKSNFDLLLQSKAIDSACSNVAERANIKHELHKIGLNLMPAGERIAYYINKGYEVITF
ncbi:MAG: hypothetical protein QXG05_08980 [Nitrososphaerota archaeon]